MKHNHYYKLFDTNRKFSQKLEYIMLSTIVKSAIKSTGKRYASTISGVNAREIIDRYFF